MNRCESIFCIYNNNFFCSLNKIHINSLGMCDECILVNIENKIIEKAKTDQLKDLRKRYNKYYFKHKNN